MLFKKLQKSQFYILFAVVFSFFFLIYFFTFNYSNDENYKINLMNDYFINEISYLTTLNCSFTLNTLEDFLNKTNLPVKIIQYWDSCNNKLIELQPYKEKIVIKNDKACLNNKCFNLIKEKRNICLVYSINSFIFFQCI
jgi:hypothetical protein